MTDPLENLIDAADDFIGQAEGARETVDAGLRDAGEALSEIDSAIDGLKHEARSLSMRLDEARDAAPHLADPVMAATIMAIDNLLALLTEARKYLTDANKLSAIGTLAIFDEHAEDLRA